MDSVKHYRRLAQTVHWVSALLVVLAWALGALGEDLTNDETRNIVGLVHIVIGQAIFVLLVLRLLWRAKAPPAMATTLGPLGDLVGRFAHFTIYALLIAVPVTGVVTLFQGGDALPLAGLIDINSPWPGSRPLRQYAKGIRAALAHALVLLACLHAAAALVHRFLLRDRLPTRIPPRDERRPA